MVVITRRLAAINARNRPVKPREVAATNGCMHLPLCGILSGYLFFATNALTATRPAQFCVAIAKMPNRSAVYADVVDAHAALARRFGSPYMSGRSSCRVTLPPVAASIFCARIGDA